MNIFLTILLLGAFGATQINSQTCAPNGEDPMKQMMMGMGKDFLSMIKKVLIYKMHGNCFKFQSPSEMVWNIWKNCTKQVVDELMISSNQLRTLAKEDLTQSCNNWMACCLKYADYDIASPDPQKVYEIENKFIDMITTRPEDTAVLKGINRLCISETMRKTTEKDPFKQMQNYGICFYDNVYKSCMSRDKSSGCIIKWSRIYSTYNRPAKCVTKVPKEALQDIYQTCLMKSNEEWIAEGLPAKLVLLKGDTQEIKSKNLNMTIHFFKNFIKKIAMDTLGCHSETLGFMSFTNKGTILNMKNIEDYATNAVTWENTEEREMFRKDLRNCSAQLDADPAVVEIQNFVEYFYDDPMADREMLQQKSGMKLVMMFRNCFYEKFGETCGLNNEITQLTFPNWNFKLLNMFVKEFFDKGGQAAIDFLKNMKKEVMEKINTMMDM